MTMLFTCYFIIKFDQYWPAVHFNIVTSRRFYLPYFLTQNAKLQMTEAIYSDISFYEYNLIFLYIEKNT